MASKYASKQFWIDTADRAVATFAQAAVGTLTAGVTGILEIDPIQLASVAGLAGAVSVLTSVAFRGGAEPAKSAPVVTHVYNGIPGAVPAPYVTTDDEPKHSA